MRFPRVGSERFSRRKSATTRSARQLLRLLMLVSDVGLQCLSCREYTTACRTSMLVCHLVLPFQRLSVCPEGVIRPYVFAAGESVTAITRPAA